MFSRRPHVVPCSVAAVMCFVAVGEQPYAYYMLLRVVVFVSALATLYVAFRAKSLVALWAFGVIALLFNPILRVHLTKSIWQYVDAVTGIVFLAAAIGLKLPLDLTTRKDHWPD